MKAGLPEYALEWWLDGTNSSPTTPGWSSIDVNGAGFYPTFPSASYVHPDYDSADVMANIDAWTADGYGHGVESSRQRPGPRGDVLGLQLRRRRFGLLRRRMDQRLGQRQGRGRRLHPRRTNFTIMRSIGTQATTNGPSIRTTVVRILPIAPAWNATATGS